MLSVMTLTEQAKKYLQIQGVSLPKTDEEIRAKAAYDLLKKDGDFIAAHQFRLNKHRENFTRDDWQQIIEMSGIDRVKRNIAGFTACLWHGLL